MAFPGGRMARISLVLAIIVVGVVIYSILAKEPPGIDGAGSGDVVNMEVDYAFAPSDKRQLIGYATNAFVGRVVEKVGAKGPLSPARETKPCPGPSSPSRC